MYQISQFGRSQVHYAEAVDVLDNIKPECIDLIYTDPPYPRKEAVPCFQLLAEHAPRILKDGGSLVSLVPHYLLEEVMEIFRGKLKYRWIYMMSQLNGSHARMAMGYEVVWKPMVHWVKNRFPKSRHYGFMLDGIEIPGPDKRFHEWQQHDAWCYYIPKLTKPGEMVLDPFFGTGTVGEACLRLDRRFIGIENDAETFQKAVERLKSLELGEK